MRSDIFVNFLNMDNQQAIKCRFWRGVLLALLVAVLTASSSSAGTIHRSFRTREAGLGFGTGTAGVACPVDAKIDKTPAYVTAESAAKEKKLGFWAEENPINPYEWRKNKRKM